MAASDHYRSFARRPVSLTGNLTCAGDGRRTEANVADIGLGGARVLVREPLPVGTPVRLELVAPTLWDPLVLGATVAWCSPLEKTEAALVGVTFCHGSGADVRALVQLIASCAYD